MVYIYRGCIKIRGLYETYEYKDTAELSESQDIQCANERLLESGHRKKQGSNNTTH